MDLQLFYRDTEQVDNWMSKQEVTFKLDPCWPGRQGPVLLHLSGLLTFFQEIRAVLALNQTKEGELSRFLSGLPVSLTVRATEKALTHLWDVKFFTKEFFFLKI
jgi:hypothetical protein